MNARIIGRTGRDVIVPITRIGAMPGAGPTGRVGVVSDTEPLPVPRNITRGPVSSPMSDAAPRWANIAFGVLFLVPELLLLALVIYWQVVPP